MQSQATLPDHIQQIRINYLSQINLLITEFQKINEACPKGVTKENYPNWNNKQIINYWWSGDINDSPNDLKPSSKIHSTLTAHSTQIRQTTFCQKCWSTWCSGTLCKRITKSPEARLKDTKNVKQKSPPMTEQLIKNLQWSLGQCWLPTQTSWSAMRYTFDAGRICQR